MTIADVVVCPEPIPLGRETFTLHAGVLHQHSLLSFTMSWEYESVVQWHISTCSCLCLYQK